MKLSSSSPAPHPPDLGDALASVIARVLEIDKSTITNSLSPAQVPSWDSFNALLLVSELEKEFKVTFTMDEVTAVKCVKDIKDALRKHHISI